MLPFSFLPIAKILNATISAFPLNIIKQLSRRDVSRYVADTR